MCQILSFIFPSLVEIASSLLDGLILICESIYHVDFLWWFCKCYFSILTLRFKLFGLNMLTLSLRFFLLSDGLLTSSISKYIRSYIWLTSVVSVRMCCLCTGYYSYLLPHESSGRFLTAVRLQSTLTIGASIKFGIYYISIK